METKKTKRANLENKKNMFLQIGFIVVLALTLGAFEWGSSNFNNESFIPLTNVDDDVEIDIIMRTTRFEPPPPPPPDVIPEFNIIEEDIPIEDEFILGDREGGNDIAITIEPIDDEENVNDSIFYFVSDPPSFRGGGTGNFLKYIQTQLVYPISAVEHGISGTVYISFVVDKKGRVTNVQIGREVHPSLDEEAKRVIEASPAWAPGEQMGKTVNVAFIMPVKFKLNN